MITIYQIETQDSYDDTYTEHCESWDEAALSFNDLVVAEERYGNLYRIEITDTKVDAKLAIALIEQQHHPLIKWRNLYGADWNQDNTHTIRQLLPTEQYRPYELDVPWDVEKG